MVAQIDEQHAAMVADTMAPAGQANGFADVALAERAAGMGPVAMHGRPERAVGIKGIGEPKRAQPKRAVGLAEPVRGGNRMRPVWGSKRRARARLSWPS